MREVSSNSLKKMDLIHMKVLKTEVLLHWIIINGISHLLLVLLFHYIFNHL